MDNHEHPYVGIIHVEMFQVTIPVFTCLSTMVDTLISLGIDADPSWKEGPPSHGMAVLCEDSKGSSVFAMMLDIEADFMTWAHEIAHIVDMIFMATGIPSGIENTETRAYMTGHIWEQLETIMGEQYLQMAQEVSEFHEETLPGEEPIPTVH